ncbi:Hypothetical predicted protein [Olea europaea subsp. europaea]|uniref:Uncharacterized protein n=1 Tax=Olea europaea subsp. europaea TaxID=158383 RepID=A0A8S0Q8I4_OLEEU|nr:Hypothetical predicted protein [Olea europaea subsp. europaea]
MRSGGEIRQLTLIEDIKEHKDAIWGRDIDIVIMDLSRDARGMNFLYILNHEGNNYFILWIKHDGKRARDPSLCVIAEKTNRAMADSHIREEIETTVVGELGGADIKWLQYDSSMFKRLCNVGDVHVALELVALYAVLPQIIKWPTVIFCMNTDLLLNAFMMNSTGSSEVLLNLEP